MRLRLPVCVLVAGLAAGCSAGTPAPAEPSAQSSPTAAPGPSTPLPVRTFDELSHDHVQGKVDYPEVPPVGGAHNARWLACGVYDEPVPAEAAVHSMEHGGVWITHDPALPAADVETLAALTDLDQQYVLVTPFEGLPSPIVVSSWGVQLQVESADDGRLVDFIRTYAGGDQGGEPGAPCRTGGLDLAEARQAVDG
jgi:hypothetical protein